MPRFKQRIAVDFDGVIHAHVSPWTHEGEIHDGPVLGAIEWLRSTLEEYDIHIFSARAKTPRGRAAIHNWLVEYCPDIATKLHIDTEKPSAILYIDDRGYHFAGTFPSLEFIRNFQPWNRRQAASQ